MGKSKNGNRPTPTEGVPDHTVSISADLRHEKKTSNEDKDDAFPLPHPPLQHNSTIPTRVMSDRAPLRDRTLVLRILVPGLEARLRDKMKETGETGAGVKERILDLEGVTCEPTPARNHTLWSFHCDGATYPAKLVNLPCPVELHKTHDHAAYYKSADIAQMLIVYEDEMALEEAEEKPVEGFPSYYHSGLTPPMKRVVERRFAAREHKAAAPPRAAVTDVETEIVKLMEQIANSEKAASKRSKVPQLTSANKIFEEVVEEVVDYEPWMNDFGRQSAGVEFDADDQQCSLHPEVWLSPETIKEIKLIEEDERKKKQAVLDKKEAKRNAKKWEKEASTKKGIAMKRSTDMVDEVTAAAMMVHEGGDEVDLLDDDNFLDLDLDGEDMLNLGDLDFNL